MKTTAAILVELGRALEIAEISIPRLKPGQVLVEIAYSGACGTQVGEARGTRGPDNWLPHLLGHEGVGVALEIGEDVTRIKPGDKVLLSWLKGPGLEAGGTVYDWEGRKVNSGGVTTFQRHGLVSENRLTLLPDTLPLDQAVLLGCALPTGLGAVANTGAARPGESLAVFGVGGVGLCAVMGGVVSGCAPIIALDVNPDKLALAQRCGATHLVNVSQTESLEAIKAICPQGVDLAVEATGNTQVMATALQVVRNQGGRAVILGNAPHGHNVTIDPLQFNLGKRMCGSWGGDSDPARDYPRYIDLLQRGTLDVTPLLSAPYRLEDINIALDDLAAGRVGRPLIHMAL